MKTVTDPYIDPKFDCRALSRTMLPDEALLAPGVLQTE